MSVTIEEVLDLKELKKFIKFPFKLYKNDPHWIPPLNSDEMNILRKDKNPAFEHCEARYFLAYKDGTIVGRIAGIINHNANDDWNEKKVRFGWFDFIDDLEVSRKLLKCVEDWGRERGMDTINGPWGFSDMDKEGLLTEGFDKMQSITTLYNYPYYKDHLEKHNYKKECEWLQYSIELGEIPEKIEEFDAIVKDKFELSVIQPKKAKEIRRRGKEIFEVLNNAYATVHEFTRLTKKQINHYINEYVPFLHKDLVCVVVDKADKVIGFAITMPCLSEGFIKAKGKLFPFSFRHILKSIRTLDTIELYLIGVNPEYRNKGVNALIFNHLHKNYQNHNVKLVVTNPQLENNYAVLRLFDHYENKKIYARRRCYFNHLSNQAKNDLCQ